MAFTIILFLFLCASYAPFCKVLHSRTALRAFLRSRAAFFKAQQLFQSSTAKFPIFIIPHFDAKGKRLLQISLRCA